MISALVGASAVAVSAILGTCGKRSWSIVSLRYSGLKSCPHCETQCASSMANSDIPMCSATCSNRDRKLGISKRSGATYNTCTSPRSSAVVTLLNCSEFKLELRNEALTPSCCSASTWSCIRAMSGDITIPTPSRNSAGSW